MSMSVEGVAYQEIKLYGTQKNSHISGWLYVFYDIDRLVDQSEEAKAAIKEEAKDQEESQLIFESDKDALHYQLLIDNNNDMTNDFS